MPSDHWRCAHDHLRSMGYVNQFKLLIYLTCPEIYGNVSNPLVPMHYFKDVRGFVMLTIIGSVAGTLYISLSILWPSREHLLLNFYNNSDVQ